MKNSYECTYFQVMGLIPVFGLGTRDISRSLGVVWQGLGSVSSNSPGSVHPTHNLLNNTV